MPKKPAKAPAVKALEMKPVESSNLEAVGYDPVSREMTVHFKNGGKYKFSNVPEHKHSALMKAESLGRHFQTHIRFHHDFEKLSSA